MHSRPADESHGPARGCSRQAGEDDDQRHGGALPAGQGEPAVRRRPAQSALGVRLDLRRHLERLRLRRARDRRLRPQDRRLARERTATAGFVLDALEQALHARRPLDGGLVHHSDRGVQADSDGRRNTLEEEVAMATRKRRSDRSGRAPLPSPGRPPVAGRDERSLVLVSDRIRDEQRGCCARGRHRAVGRQRRRFVRQCTRRDGDRPVQTEVIHRCGPWQSFDAVEYATLEWVDWFNTRRLLEPIGNIPPAEAEANYYTALEHPRMAAACCCEPPQAATIDPLCRALGITLPELPPALSPIVWCLNRAKVSKAEMKRLDITGDQFHPELRALSGTSCGTRNLYVRRR